MAVSKQPTITPETSSGEGLDEEPSRGEAKWKRFHPFRVVRKIFRRRIKREGTNVVSESSKKSWSTSELQSVQDDSSGKCEVTSPLKIGLSVSHDSIFSPENNTNIVSNETINVSHGSSLSVRHTSMKNMFKDELFTRIRARRDSDDDGIGLQNSPYSSPTTVDVLNQGFKEKLPKSQTTCSAGSLISMGSSENDEDSTGQSSGHSSRMSLIDRRSLDSEAESEVAHPVPLNHNAAHHKIAIRPKRNYGLPRRRVKQVAASKVTSLPSTPEVTEDVTKCIQKLEVTEITSTTEIASLSGTEIITSVSLTEKFESFQSEIVSSSEVSQNTSESQELDEKEFSEISSLNKTDFEDLKWTEQDTDLKEATCSISDAQKATADNTFEETDVSKETSKVNTIFDTKPDFIDKIEVTEVEGSYSFNKTTLQEKSEVICTEDHLLDNTEAPISVSSMVKSIEKSDSFKNSDKFKKPLEEAKHNIENTYEYNDTSIKMQITKDFVGENELTISEESNFPHSPPGTQNVADSISEKSTFSASQDLSLISTDCINELVKRNAVAETLDIESEFVLKPLKKDRKFSGEKDSAYKDTVPDKQKENSLVSSIYLEEESIMSNKSLSLGVEESRIFVSHHTSFSDDLKDILVTEAHNYTAVEEKPEIPIHTTEDTVSNKIRETGEPYISSIGITPSVNSGTDITFNSSICEKTMSEDKITISVSSNTDNLKSKPLSLKSNDMTETSMHKTSTVSAETDACSKGTEKQQKPSQKSHLPDVTSSMVSMKNLTSQKRVSVEIVPFSQRMKERKYQPISFPNKEGSSENKKNPSALVERKLSDRKVTKSKELEKSNNRHSFSGTFTTDNRKDEELIINKKELKNEKLQYPVQIRIHKSSPKPEIKDKNIVNPSISSELKNKESSSSETKFHMHSSKIAQNDVKLIKDEKIVEEAPKWEIKIQPAISHTNVPKTMNTEENSTSVISQNNFILKSEPPKFTGNENKNVNSDAESVVTKGIENYWKSSKDSAVLPDDPEPELLRVFARRSIKQKNCDKSKLDEKEMDSNIAAPDSPVVEESEKTKDMISISVNSTVIKISENSKPHITKPDLKKKSKSFCEKEKVVPRSISPLKEMNLIQRDSSTRSSVDSLISSETLHPRQRLVNSNDAPVTLPPESEKRNSAKSAQNESTTENSLPLSSKEEHLHKSCSISTTPPSTSVNGNLSTIGMVKENQEVIPSGKEAHTPAWLQLAQQRRELREQRERLLLGGSPNSFMDASNKPSRSSKVWDMVNNFQKLQMT